jgi:hypothetical protein
MEEERARLRNKSFWKFFLRGLINLENSLCCGSIMENKKRYWILWKIRKRVTSSEVYTNFWRIVKYIKSDMLWINFKRTGRHLKLGKKLWMWCWILHMAKFPKCFAIGRYYLRNWTKLGLEMRMNFQRSWIDYIIWSWIRFLTLSNKLTLAAKNWR